MLYDDHEPTYYEEQLARYEAMKSRTIDYTFKNKGAYLVKETKLYAIEVMGVREDGTFIYSQWELLNDSNYDYLTLKLPGECVMFAFRFDITWGTDWPYSGVFWTDIDTPVTDIYIESSGFCRMACLKIRVNHEQIYAGYNLPAHDEWVPGPA